MLLVTRFNGDEFSSDVGDGRFGSFSEVDARIGEVCFAPINGLRQSGLSGPKSVRPGPMHRSKLHARTAVIYSITSSARASDRAAPIALR
jgi:hypothetical protein